MYFDVRNKPIRKYCPRVGSSANLQMFAMIYFDSCFFPKYSMKRVVFTNNLVNKKVFRERSRDSWYQVIFLNSILFTACSLTRNPVSSPKWRCEGTGAQMRTNGSAATNCQKVVLLGKRNSNPNNLGWRESIPKSSAIVDFKELRQHAVLRPEKQSCIKLN